MNADLIKFIESTPDTMVTLLNNEKFIVRETPVEIIKKVTDYAREVRGISDYLANLGVS